MKNVTRNGVSLALVLVLGALSMTGCASLWGKSSGKKAVPPSVVSTYPKDAASNVEINGAIIAIFSKDMDVATMSSANFTVVKDGAPINGRVSYDPLTRTAIFKPTNELIRDTTYTVTVLSAAKDAAGMAMAADESWNFMTGAEQDTGAPTIVMAFPSNLSTGVSAKSLVSASFSEPVAPSTVVAANFIVKAGAAIVPGAMVYDLAKRTVTFTPAKELAANVAHTVTVTKGITDIAGNPLVGVFEWTFTPGVSLDTVAPTVIATFPVNATLDAGINNSITVSFSEPMNNDTISSSQFIVMAGTKPVPGKVTYDLPNKSAIFAPAFSLEHATVYSVTITNGVKDLAGNPLSANKVWSFTTGKPGAGPAPVLLGNASNFTILAKTAIANVQPSAITGDIGLGPAAKSFVTGFDQLDTAGYGTSAQVTGFMHVADMAPPTTSNMIKAISDMAAAYADAEGRAPADIVSLSSGNLGGLSLNPGLYRWDSPVTIPADITIIGGSGDVWIFQVNGDLTVSSGASVRLEGGAQARNVFWQVSGTANLGAGSHFEGTILCKNAVTLEAKASLTGRILANTKVSLDQAIVTKPAR